jgi:hypothetical protein
MADAFEDSFEDLLDEPEYEEIEEPAPKRPRKKRNIGGCFLNLLSGILVTGTLVVGLIFAIIFINPQTMINPLPPTTLPVIALTNTPTPTAQGILPPTWTPTFSPTPEPTDTPTPTDTPLPTATPIPTADLESGTTFDIQQGSPAYEANPYHADAGCNWLGIGGQIFDLDVAPISGILVEVGGTLGDIEITGLTLSGMATDYGDGGYEITLHDAPIASDGEVWIQLLDQANLPLSEQIYFETFDSCDSNLIRINFQQVASE